MERRYERLIPTGVKGGRIESSTLTITTSLGDHVIPWEDVEFLSINRIEEVKQIALKDQNRSSSSMMGTGYAKAMTCQNKTVKKKVTQSEVYTAFLVARNQEKPFRFDTITTNYRQMLGPDAGYSAWVNFSAVFIKIINNSPNIILDSSAKDFPQQGKKSVATYSSREKAFDEAMKYYEKNKNSININSENPHSRDDEIIRFSLED